ncbi:MAG TPA: hypothetical protein VFX54_08885 [Candidatus Binatia bacterium]|nr:hypothetical protein [Candidatus Binatia bacterium]
MKVIDCDAHVEECVETWQYLDPEFYLLRPIPVTFPEDTCFGTHNAAWVIDYKLRFFAANPTTMKRASEKDVPIPVQEMRDIKQRLSYMDELGIDKQVVFPSIWLGCLAENVELEAALARSPRATRRPMARRKSFCLLRHRSGYLRAGHRVALHDTDQNASQRLTRVIHTILHR